MTCSRLDLICVAFTGLALVSACGTSGSGESMDAAAETEGSMTSGTTESEPPGSTTAETTGTTSEPRTSSSSDDSGTGFFVDAEVVTYPQQPMVVDVVFSEPGLSVTASVVDDPGVKIAELDDGGGEETRVRVRGLAPAAAHELTWSVQDPSGRTAEGVSQIQTDAPLPGFVPSFEVDGNPAGLGEYLLFDVTNVGNPRYSSMFAVDQQGTTRWHYGVEYRTVDPSIVFAAAKQRADGSTIFLRDYAIVAIDELGEETLRIDSEDLGVAGLHHDFVELENGNFLTMSFVFQYVEDAEGGETYVGGDSILEITPAGEIVWEWNMFDHLDVNRRPEGFDDPLLDPETGIEGKDWTHSNGLVYEPATDSVLVSIRHQDWLIRIDRSTGEVAWRLGFEGDFELSEGTWFWHQHSPQWQPDGSLLLYDNGIHNPNLLPEEESSRVVRYVLDEGTMSATQVWEDEEEPFMAPIAGDADRLDDGSYLVTDSSIDFGVLMPYARIRKVDEAAPAMPQWTLLTEVGTFVYRCISVPRLVGQPADR